MRSFAVKEKRPAPAAVSRRPYGHTPFGRAQQAAIHNILRSTGAQAKLTIGQPNDKYEQEADRVADQVMRMSDADVAQRVESGTVQPMRIQRMCPECEEELAQRQPAEEEDEEEILQAKEQTDRMPQVTPNIESRINSLKGSGRPLDPATRSFFEPRFGHDFSRVRVHMDSAAADTARSIHASAFTLGNHVVMGSGEYQPNSRSGKRLLGHELTHVMQQRKERHTLYKQFQMPKQPKTALSSDVKELSTIVSLSPDQSISTTSVDTESSYIGRIQRQVRPQLSVGADRSSFESIVEKDAFDLCVATNAMGFIPPVTEAVVEGTFRAMQAAIVHQVQSMREFERAIEEFSAVLLLSSPDERTRFIAHHRHNLMNYGISGQTVADVNIGDWRIVIVGSPGLRSKREFVERHERGHVGLHSLGVPGNQHHFILQMLGLGIERIPHLGTRIR